MKKNLSSIILVVAIIIAGIIFFTSGDKKDNNENYNGSDVVVTINDKKIYREELEKEKEIILSNQGDQELDDETKKQIEDQIIDNFISEELLKQAAAESGVIVNDEEIDVEIELFKSQFPSDEEYEQYLLDSDIEEEEINEEVKTFLLIQKYAEQELGTSSLTASEEEVQQAYAQFATQEGIPELSEIYEQVEDFVIQQKEQELFIELIDKLKAEAEVEISI